jgi:hypothetical protein
VQRIAGMGGIHIRMANGIGVMAADQDYVWLDILHNEDLMVYSDGQGENRKTCGMSEKR